MSAGTLEVQSKSGDIPYAVAQGATLKVGYSTGGGYANTGLTINGNGASATNGFYLQGGRSYNASGEIVLLTGPTTPRQCGSGLAGIGTFDINGTGLWCTAAASGSAIDPNVQIISSGYGMSMQIDAGAANVTGDLTVNGPLNVGSLGLYKRGTGSLLFKGTAASGNTALNLQGGGVICGAANCIGVNAAVPMLSGTSLRLDGFSQAIASLNAAAGSMLSFGGTNTLTVGSAPVLAGTLQMAINKGTTPFSARLIVASGTLTFGGALVVTNLGGYTLAGGDTFTLFSAPSYAGAFSTLTLPGLSSSLRWNTNSLGVNGTITVNDTRPAITNMSMGADRNSFTLAGTGTAGQAYVLLTASDLPPPAWLPILTNTTDINGLFSFIDLQVSTHAQRFYRISTGHGRSSRNLQTIAARHPCTPPRQFVVPSSAGRVRQSPSNPLLSSSNVYVTPPSEPLTLTGVADRLATAPPPLTATTTA